MEWWETLNCAGMLNAVGSDADPAMDSDDKAMYCKHYAMSGPTADMTFPAEKLIAADSDVDMKIEEYFNKRYEVITDATATSHEDTGLMPNTDYSYRIRAVHGMKAGMWSNTAMAMTDDIAPNMPNGVAAMVNSRTQITVSWMAPDDNGGSAVTGYMVMYKATDSDGDYMSMSAMADATSAAVGDLMPGTSYTFKVRADNAAGMGAYAEAVMATTTANMMPMAGDAIGDVTATEGDDPIMVQSTITDGDDAMLTWMASSDHGDVAAATVDNMGMVTVTIGHAGTATITVKATDMFDAYAEQTFMVTVESGITELTAPTGLDADVDDSNPGAAIITVTWTDGLNADRHVVFLFDNSDDSVVGINTAQTDGETTFQNVASGEYTVWVLSVENGPSGNARDFRATTITVTVN